MISKDGKRLFFLSSRLLFFFAFFFLNSGKMKGELIQRYLVNKRGVAVNETTSEEINRMLSGRQQLTVVFVFTPLCGTCKLAEGMLKVILAKEPTLDMKKLNINYAPSFAQKWKIESVPCLLVFQKGLGVERLYAFHSVEYLYEKLKPYAAITKLSKIK